VESAIDESGSGDKSFKGENGYPKYIPDGSLLAIYSSLNIEQ